MRCETSFFSLTLYKKHLKRYWPMWAAWLALWLLAIPVQLWNRASLYYGGGRDLQALADELPKDMLVFLFPSLCVLGALVAVAVFFHLFKSPAANFIGALPLRREGVFATALAAGYTMMMAPLVVVGAVTMIVEVALGCGSPSILIFVGAGALNSFFWLCFATLCCVISGHAVAAVVFYAIFNFIVPVMVALVEGLLTGFLYGFTGFSEGFYEATNWLCPVAKLTRDSWLGNWDHKALDWEMLAIYAAVGFLMLLVSIGLHHIRKAERSGDLIAFDPVKWLFKICVTVCGGIGFGTFFTILIFNNLTVSAEGWKFGICCAVAAFLCYMVSEMLLAKSFKVWKHWKGGVISAVCFILVVAAVDMDWIGFTTRVPNPASVKTVTAYFDGTNMTSAASRGLSFTGEDVRAVTDLHQYLVDHRDDTDGNKNQYLRLELDYDLGWTSLRRQYTCWYDTGDEMGSRVSAALDVGQIYFPAQRGIPSEIDLSLQVPIDTTGMSEEEKERYADDTEYIGTEIDYSDIAPLWEAVKADVAAGRYRSTYLSSENKRKVNTGTLYFRWHSEREHHYYEVDLSPALTKTWKTLDERGYLNDVRNYHAPETSVWPAS